MARLLKLTTDALPSYTEEQICVTVCGWKEETKRQETEIRRMRERTKGRISKPLHGTPQAYLSSVAGVDLQLRRSQQLAEGAPVSGMPFCG